MHQKKEITQIVCLTEKVISYYSKCVAGLFRLEIKFNVLTQNTG